MKLSKEIQQELHERFQALTPNEMQWLDQGIDQKAGLVLLYNLIPEADSILKQGLPSLKGHQFDPKRLLHGSVVGDAQFQPSTENGGPPMQAPPDQPPMQPPSSALNGLGGPPPQMVEEI